MHSAIENEFFYYARFSLFLPLFRLYPLWVMMWLEDFVGELAYQEKHTVTASETNVLT